ncbi:monooxygenase 2-like isoform X2 [Vicia villosa]|uniref:monooxygenase 2-like isoform X2 n=1 Tax=Vicia villosa TaxID=3911 RepID=UPI00273C00F0|nr:monooxygenase 2-like isoform X2 [Vicia villosa]
MESIIEENIVIVGAGIAGLTTSLGLHRLGIRSLVLESSGSLRASGFALTTWENAWKALDAVGVGDILRRQHIQLHGGSHEVCCVRRQLMLEAIANELPSGTIRYMSKVVAIQESGVSKILHIADGTTVKTKILIGSDGINSMVAKWLGFKEASSTGRYATRGYVELKNSHKLEPLFMQYFGKGFRAGVIPCNDKGVYWFFTWTPTIKDHQKELAQDPAKLKQYVLSKLGKMPNYVRSFIENTELDAFHLAPLRHRHPWELIIKSISKGNVCVVGDALHPMAPDLAQGGCSALEDGVVLARCLAEAFSKNQMEGEEEYKIIETCLKKYAKERRWRCIDLITRSYIVGSIQQSGSKLVNFFRDKVFATFLAHQLLKKSNFDCQQLK